MNADRSFGEWLRRQRRTLDLTQGELARQVGCSAITLKKLEAEARRPSKQMAERLADVLQVPLDERANFLRFARGDPFAAPVQESDQRLTRTGKSQSAPASATLPDVDYGSLRHLPVQPTPFIGRGQELAEISERLADPACRLLTLIGPGGIGKTRLALQAAAQVPPAAFAHGVFFVPLAPLSSAEAVVITMAHALGFAFYGRRDPKVQLLRYLDGKQILLVLDNFEHLLESAPLVAEALASVPGSKFLVTSRERLNLQGEWLLEISGLEVPAGEQTESVDAAAYSAVQLFVQSARRIQPTFILADDEKPSVIRICQSVEGMPLGIELAASWLRALSCEDIDAEIRRHLGFLATTVRDVPERHRSLLAVFDHSWKLLTAEERRVFLNLCVFRGGFDRQAAEQVAGASLPILTALLDKSLLRRSAAGRYDLHELLRQYARYKLEEAGETEAVSRRHRDWCLRLAEQAFPPGIWGAAGSLWLDRLEVEHDNLRTALAWSMVDRGAAEERLRLAGRLVWFWYVHAHYGEGRRWLEQALGLSEGASPASRAYALMGVGILAAQQGDYERAVPLCQQALALYRELRDPMQSGWMLMHLGRIATHKGDYEQAGALLEESLACFQESETYPGAMATSRLALGIAACYRGDYDRAAGLLEQSLPSLRVIGDGVDVAGALHGLGMVACRRGDLAKAKRLFEEGLVASQERGARLEFVECIEGLATVAGAQGQAARAARLLGIAEGIRLVIGTPLSPAERSTYAQYATSIRAQLTEAAFAAALAEGQAMTPEEAIKLAQQEPDSRSH